MTLLPKYIKIGNSVVPQILVVVMKFVVINFPKNINLLAFIHD